MTIGSIIGAARSVAAAAWRRDDAQPAHEAALRAAVPDASRADRIVRSPGWQQHGNRAAIVHIAAAAGAEGDEALAELLQDPDRLARTDARGRTLLANLDALATQDLHHRIADHGGGEALRSAFVDSTLGDIVHPTSNVTQNGADTCASTTAQIALARDDPAEYVRLLVGLTGDDGHTTMRGGGTLGLQQESFADGGLAGADGRSASEVIFQGAAVEFANGRFIDYDARNDEYDLAGPSGPIGWLTDSHYQGPRGLTAGMQASLLHNLFGGRYETLFGHGNILASGFGLRRMGAGEGADAHAYLQGYRGEAPVEITYRFLDTDGGGDPKSSHAVLFDHVDPATGRVYFQNPWGDRDPGHSGKAGHVDAAHPDLFYLTRDEFVNNAIWVVGPARPYPAVQVPTGTTTSTSTTMPPVVEPTPATTVPSASADEGTPTGTTTTTTTTAPFADAG